LPFYYQYDEIVFTHLYPVAPDQKPAAFERLLTVLLLIEVATFTLVTLLRLQWLTAGAISFAAWFSSGALHGGMHECDLSSIMWWYRGEWFLDSSLV
ncbi:hypothetical protein PZ01_08200, partial [Lacticaseibacillus rhamnosus]